jgi:hypothetical protein
MNKRIRNKKVRNALIRAEVHMMREGFYTLAQAKREVYHAYGATHRRRLRAAIRAMPEFPTVSVLDTMVERIRATLVAKRKNKINPGVYEYESV